MAAHTVAAAASWSCRDGSHGLGRENEREQNKCSLGAAAFVVGCKGIIANNARYFNLEREAAAAAALDMAAAVRARHGAGSCGGRWAWEQRVRPTAGGGERASIGARMMREQLTGLALAEEWKSWMLKRRAAEAAAAGGDCRLHCANMSCCWRKQQLHARVRDDE